MEFAVLKVARVVALKKFRGIYSLILMDHLTFLESCFIDSACKLVEETGSDRKIGAEFGAFLLENAATNDHIL